MLLGREAASLCRRTARDWVVVNAVDVVARVAAATTRTRKEAILFIMVKVELEAIGSTNAIAIIVVVVEILMVMLLFVLCSVLVGLVPAKICHPPRSVRHVLELEVSRVKLLSPAKSARACALFRAPKIECPLVAARHQKAKAA